MDLVKLENNLPIRSYSDTDLNTVLIMDFMPWLASLLSLTDETSAERLEIALPAIKTQCIGMGFAEIKKMFEMYADGKLSVKPMANYFDRILLGRIIADYKAQKPKEKKVIKTIEVSEEETNRIIDKHITESVMHFQNTKEILYPYLYDKLYARKLLPPHTPEFKERIKKKASDMLKSEKKNATSIDDFKNFERMIKEEQTITAYLKKVVLIEYFESVTKQ